MFKTLLLSLLSLLLLSGCNPKDKSTNTVTSFALDTAITATVTDKKDYNKLQNAINSINEYEKLFSKTIKDSDISKINKEKNVKLSTLNEKTVELLKISSNISYTTNGAFDFTLGKLSTLWNFTGKNPHIPSKDKINHALSQSGYKNFSITDEEISMISDIDIDLGGIAKGYITDIIVDDLKKNNVNSAILSLGGNVYALGNKNGEKWKIGIANPNSPNEIVGYVEVEDKSVVTSGIYQRFFKEDDKIYHHIIDAKTGYPANSQLKSVTIISENSTLADAYSTAFFVMGYEKSVNFLKENNITDIDAIFITDTDEILYTENVDKYFTPKK